MDDTKKPEITMLREVGSQYPADVSDPLAIHPDKMKLIADFIMRNVDKEDQITEFVLVCIKTQVNNEKRASLVSHITNMSSELSTRALINWVLLRAERFTTFRSDEETKREPN